jgi:signal peptidase I
MPPENLPPQKKSASAEFWRFLAVVIFIILPIRLWVAEPFIVSGDSMYPTFQNHDYLIIDSLSYKIGNPERYDVIVFRYPLDTSRYFIKRVIGLPGETVTIHNKKIVVTGDAYPEGVTIDLPHLDVYTQGEITSTLGPDEYFVLGDNRPVSSDSRVWGSLKKEYIVGKPVVRLYPFREIDFLPGKVDSSTGTGQIPKNQ